VFLQAELSLYLQQTESLKSPLIDAWQYLQQQSNNSHNQWTNMSWGIPGLSYRAGRFKLGVTLTFDAHWVIVGYSYKASLPDRVRPSFTIFDIRALWRSALVSHMFDSISHKTVDYKHTNSVLLLIYCSVLRTRQHSIGYMGDGSVLLYQSWLIHCYSFAEFSTITS